MRDTLSDHRSSPLEPSPSRAPWRRTAQAVTSAFAIIMLACGMSLLFSFGLRLQDTAEAGGLAATAIVFTGQFDRIEKAIGLLEAGRIGRIFVSGVNRGAGLDVQTFARQFSLPPALEDGLATGLITLATGAQDTIENALETSCWLVRSPDTRRVLLITSHLHMPRASLLLEQASRLHIERLSTSPGDVDGRALLSPEFRRFVATWFMTFLPPRMWPARGGFACVPA
jgi:hypothetical protein